MLSSKLYRKLGQGCRFQNRLFLKNHRNLLCRRTLESKIILQLDYAVLVLLWVFSFQFADVQ